jgi:mRNA-degrading endonuclease RelE of RelBE toxin-antitoxin system
LAAEILYKASALKDLKRLDRPATRRIIGRIDTDLAAHPEEDKALTGQYKGLFSYRTGDYRVVSAMLGDTVLVLRIAHRAEAYRQN